MGKETTIFKQLILNVVVPAVIALVILAVLNYRNTHLLLINSFTEKNNIISQEIIKVMEFQDQAFEILDEDLSDRMREYSEILVNDYFPNTEGIEEADLGTIRDRMGMLPGLEDIFVISRNGIVVNTTFLEDTNLNWFEFGEEHKNYLLQVFDEGRFVNEQFTIENITNRPRKYTYQPTQDGKYIIELGVYSEKADEIIQFIETTKKDIVNNQESILDVELFFMADQLFSLNKEATLVEAHSDLLSERFTLKDTASVSATIDGKKVNYTYMYMERVNSKLYAGSVIRIITDRSEEQKLIRSELIKFLIMFGLTSLAVVLLTYRKTRVITDPIKNLVQNVNRITNGHLDERADVVGNNEITTLSQHFNLMIEQLEVLYNNLEQKVKERTAEIQRQKEEIEAQRDSIEEQRNLLSDRNKRLKSAYLEIEEQQRHITDSIYYARRIQTAILPPESFIKKIFRDYFIYYRPKDIVSGDFYWIEKKGDLEMFAAVDCTGHGVPGAFMSIVGYNQLNYAVNVAKARTPNAILDSLNEGVTETLRESSDPESVKDGMDIALCTLDRKKMRLEYAGAYNPLYLVRNCELIIFKGDKQPIGAFVDKDLHKFNNYGMDVKEGDSIYLFSDGFADQFGGTNGKKFLLKNFRELILKICEKPMSEQQVIIHQTFEEWKGKEEQVDDVLIIAVKV
jgi:serine phosphatase RsbU (regulator of sigma subunit)